MKGEDENKEMRKQSNKRMKNIKYIKGNRNKVGK